MTLASGLTKKPGTVLVVLDARLSREKASLLTRAINAIRTLATVETLPGSTTEELLIARLEKSNYDLVLLPWHLYLAWKRAEAFWGLTRTSGPTVAGYFCDALPTTQLAEHAVNLRTILLDFVNLQVPEITLLVKCLLKDTLRSGIKPLIDVDTKIYVENWFGSQGLGNRIDSVLGLAEFSDAKWSKRGSSIRICLNALWSLIYEQGTVKNEFAQNTPVPKAYFQVACDRETAVFRLCYTTTFCSPKESVAGYWPNSKNPTDPAQLLLRYSDFLRVHTFANSQDLEITVGFFNSAPCEQAHDQLHTLWVEPFALHLLTEPYFEAPGPGSPRLRPLPKGLSEPTQLRSVPTKEKSATTITAPPPDPTIEQAKVIALKSILKKKDEIIQELKTGGVGTAAPLPPPDAESLLEAFQEKYFEARFQIRQLELEIVAMEKRGATPEEFKNIRQKMEALANREQAWIKKLATTIETFKTAQKK